MRTRLISSLAIAVAAAYLVAASHSLTLSAIAELAFGIGIGTPSSHSASRGTTTLTPQPHVAEVLTVAVSAWTIGASLVLAEPTLASSLASSASGNGQPTGPAGRRR
jgi:hypothetical protein